MRITDARFELTAVKPEQYPAGVKPEAAFVGRSNVGKSSVINALANRRSLARVGATPGKTRVINFYYINDKLYLVDLPGYGYANVSNTEKASWHSMVETYLNGRPQLKLVIMLVDIRHVPTDDDISMYDWITANSLQHAVVAAKADKIPKSKIIQRLSDIQKTLGINSGIPFVAFSAEKKQGIEELWSIIEAGCMTD